MIVFFEFSLRKNHFKLATESNDNFICFFSCILYRIIIIIIYLFYYAKYIILEMILIGSTT